MKLKQYIEILNFKSLGLFTMKRSFKKKIVEVPSSVKGKTARYFLIKLFLTD